MAKYVLLYTDTSVMDNMNPEDYTYRDMSNQEAALLNDSLTDAFWSPVRQSATALITHID